MKIHFNNMNFYSIVSEILFFNNDENNFTDEEIFSRMFEMYKKDGYSVRVRCHAYHSFSGLGKSFEKIF